MRNETSEKSRRCYFRSFFSASAGGAMGRVESKVFPCSFSSTLHL